jgi:hypothetical protein
MWTFKPSININPAYATNNIDTQQAGLYQIAPNNSNLIVRVNTTSNIGLIGEIRLNSAITPVRFQGYTGSAWVDLNATQGIQGNRGSDFTNVVNFNNLATSTNASSVVNTGSIFATSFVDASVNISNVNIRSIQGGNYTINNNLIVNSLSISQNSNIITLTPQPLPYNWNFTGSNNTVNILKNASGDALNYSWGETSIWTVKAGITIYKGQAVQITNEPSTGNLVIIPITYTTLTGVNSFTTPMNMLGIATETKTGGQSCIICTKGITTVLCTTNTTTDFVSSTDVSSVGIDGIVGTDGGIFCNTTSIPTVNYINAGYFLEKGTTVANNGNYALFYVNTQFKVN